MSDLSTLGIDDLLVLAFQQRDADLPERALPAFQAALRLENDDAIRMELARTEILTGDRIAARQTLAEIATPPADDGEFRAELAKTHVQADQPEEAFELLAAVDPKSLYKTQAVAETLRLAERMGDKERLAAVLGGLRKPGVSQALRHLADGYEAESCGTREEAARCFKRTYLVSRDHDIGIEAGYRAARLMDRCDRGEEALRLLADVKATEARLHPCENIVAGAVRSRDHLLAMRKAIGPDHFSGRQLLKGGPGLILLGNPRSGTSLLARKVAMAAGATWVDESPAFMVEARKLFAGHEGVCEAPDALRIFNSLTNGQLDGFGAAYAGRLARFGAGLGARFIDKNPSLFNSLISLHRLLPESNWLVLLRDPRDVALSCYFQFFGTTQFGLACRTPQGALGAVETAMTGWLQAREQLLPGSVVCVKYRDLVAHPDAEVSRVLRELGWPEARGNAERAETSKINLTPSYGDIRRPVSDRSVGRHSATPRFFDNASRDWQRVVEILGDS